MSGLSLYQIATEYKADIERLADLDLPPEVVADTLESMGGELEIKAQNVIGFMRHLESTAAAIKDAERKMADRRKAVENRAKRLKEYVLETMQHHGIQKIESPYFVISIGKNPPSVDIYDEQQVPNDYLTDPPPPAPQPDKKLIAQAIKDGYEVPGCRLVQGEGLRIRGG